MNGVPAPAVYFDMDGVSHAAYLPALGGKVVQIAKRSAAAWFDQVLRGVDNTAYFTGEIIANDVARNRLARFATRQ